VVSDPKKANDKYVFFDSNQDDIHILSEEEMIKCVYWMVRKQEHDDKYEAKFETNWRYIVDRVETLQRQHSEMQISKNFNRYPHYKEDFIELKEFLENGMTKELCANEHGYWVYEKMGENPFANRKFQRYTQVKKEEKFYSYDLTHQQIEEIKDFDPLLTECKLEIDAIHKKQKTQELEGEELDAILLKIDESQAKKRSQQKKEDADQWRSIRTNFFC